SVPVGHARRKHGKGRPAPWARARQPGGREACVKKTLYEDAPLRSVGDAHEISRPPTWPVRPVKRKFVLVTNAPGGHMTLRAEPPTPARAARGAGVPTAT